MYCPDGMRLSYNPLWPLGVVPRERSIYEALANNCKDSRKQVAIYIGGLIVEIGPALETGFDVVHDGAVSMADAVVVLIPGWNLVIRQKALMTLVSHLKFGRCRGISACCCHPSQDSAVAAALSEVWDSYLLQDDAAVGGRSWLDCFSAALSLPCNKKIEPVFAFNDGQCDCDLVLLRKG